jgi:lysozyme
MTDMILRNERAFLALIEYAEGTGRNPHTGQAVDPYRTCYGYAHTIQSFADHPAVTKEWAGERLSAEHCRKAGFNPGCKSTAAGRHQITRTTWLPIKARLKLPDFGPDSQDRAALYLVTECGALEDVHAGRLEQALSKCRSKWASLPGAGFGQPERRISSLVAAFKNAGGTVA